MKPNLARKTGMFISLRIKILIAFTLLFTVVFAGAYYWFLEYATSSAMMRVQQDMIDTLEGTVDGISASEFADLSSLDSADDPLYEAHLDWLKSVHNIEPRAFVYTYVAGEGENELLFIGDTLSFVRPDDAAAFKESYVSSGPMANGLSELTFNMEIYSDEWGSWVSVYQPIRDVTGLSVGAVGIDFEAAYVNEVRGGILASLGIAFLLTYALLFTMVLLIARVFTRPIQQLTGSAEQIGSGNYNQDLSGIGNYRFPDEIFTLSRVFEMMLEKVATREADLKREVAELRIELDVSKRNAQVMEIVDSDFFRELQDKAQAARERKQRQQDQLRGSDSE